jgi:NTE family protein
VTVLHVVPSGAEVPPDAIRREVSHRWIALETAGDPALVIQQALAELERRGGLYGYILIDPSAVADSVVPPDAGPPAGIDQVVLLRTPIPGPPVLPPLPKAAITVLVTELLPPRPPMGGLPPGPLRKLAQGIHAAWLQLLQDIERLGGALPPPGDVVDEVRKEPRRVRVRLDVHRIAHDPDPAAASLPAEERESLARWARAVTNRRVGVALGGSGAWGFAHVALLRELNHRQIPVDIVGGASSGSLVGAYYSAKQLEGLDELVRQGLLLTLLVPSWFFSMASFESLLDYSLGEMPLIDLEIMLLPVTTNLSSGRWDVLRNASLPFSVRASASAPGLFPATLTERAVYVDGACIDNVPVSLVQAIGAAMVIASNALPAPTGVTPRRIPKTTVGRVLQQLNPVSRVIDFMKSFTLMLHTVGDFESAGAYVTFDPRPKKAVLGGTFLFFRANAIIKQTLEDPGFWKTVEQATKAWERLRAPRFPARTQPAEVPVRTQPAETPA